MEKNWKKFLRENCEKIEEIFKIFGGRNCWGFFLGGREKSGEKLREIFAKILGKKFVGKIFGFFLLEKIARKLQEKKSGKFLVFFCGKKLRENCKKKNRGNFWYFFAGKNCEKIARKKIGEISGIFLREN